MRQDASRSHEGWSLEYVSLMTNVTKFTVDELHDSAKEGIYIHGLFLQAASWDKRSGRIVEAKSKQLFDSMPVISITAMSQLLGEEIVKFKMPAESQDNNNAGVHSLSNVASPVPQGSIVKLNVPGLWLISYAESNKFGPSLNKLVQALNQNCQINIALVILSLGELWCCNK